MALESVLLLLVEDEALLATVLQDDLQEAGFQPIHVFSGEAAIDTLEAQADDIQGVITDIRLAGAVNGWMVARRARELKPHCPILYISGDSAHEHSANGVPESIMLQTPFAAAQLIAAISNLLNAVSGKQPL